jgi:hypothetical protein
LERALALNSTHAQARDQRIEMGPARLKTFLTTML